MKFKAIKVTQLFSSEPAPSANYPIWGEGERDELRVTGFSVIICTIL